MKLKFFKKKEEKKSIDYMSVEEIVNNFSWCSSMNDVEPKDNGLYWLNPRNQECFNFGWYTVEDFRDWARKKGEIVKGNTDQEKADVVAYALAKQKFPYGIFMYRKHFDKINLNFPTKKEQSRISSFGQRLRLDSQELCDIYGSLVYRVKNMFYDLEHLNPDSGYFDKDLYRKMNNQATNYIQGALFGLHQTRDDIHFSYSNSPCELENVSWAQDLINSYAYYLYLEEQGVGLKEIFKKVDGII